uniref:Uncharacterized protein n=1 Tax=Avena sativa TaxID=4498 RepID=A0ACD5U4W0_AVESA
MCRNVLTDEVVAGDAPKTQQPPSRPLSCVRRRAIGFNFNTSTIANNVVNALHLEAHLADAPALSYLKIQGGGDGCIRILAVDKNLILLESMLPSPQKEKEWMLSSSPRVSIYIIYDALAQSISMIPSHPWSQSCDPFSKEWGHGPTALASSILIARPPGDDGSYALVSMAEMANHSDALYLWRSSSPEWNLVKAEFPPEFKGYYASHGYTAVLAFSFGGRAFWANLVHGVMYCSCDALLSAPSRRGAILKFHFIELPIEQPRQLPPHILCAMELRSNMYRTMGRVGESSIKFVSIDGFMQLLDFVDCTVTVWSLSPNEDMTTWTEHSLCLGTLAEQQKFKKGSLSTDMVPMYPILSMEEEDIIYFMLGKYAPCCSKHKGSKKKCKEYVAVAGTALHLLRVDMRHGVLLDSVRLPNQWGVDFTFCDLNRYLCGTL